MKRNLAIMVAFALLMTPVRANPGMAALSLEQQIFSIPLALWAETLVIYFLLRRRIVSRSRFTIAYLPFTFLTFLLFMYLPDYGRYFFPWSYTIRDFADFLFWECIIVVTETAFLAYLLEWKSMKRDGMTRISLPRIFLVVIVGNLCSYFGDVFFTDFLLLSRF